MPDCARPALALLIASPAAAGNSAMLLDIAGDDVDLSGVASTSLVSGCEQSLAWTVAGTDDCWLLVDATGLRATGYALHGEGDGRIAAGAHTTLAVARAPR